jgi:hypothetical protein
VSRRFERARIEAQLFAEVCDILLSPQGHRGDTPRVDRSAARPVHGPVQVQVGR